MKMKPVLMLILMLMLTLTLPLEQMHWHLPSIHVWLGHYSQQL